MSAHAVYLVRRGPKPSYHRAPFHPVIICGKRRVAKWEAGWCGDAAWVWEHERADGHSGWLLSRWNGFDVDYGHVVRGVAMPDGTDGGFIHDESAEPWTLLQGAVWWDDRRMPAWLQVAGVVYPPDTFSQQAILDFIADDGISGTGTRLLPSCWSNTVSPLGEHVHDSEAP